MEYVAVEVQAADFGGVPLEAIVRIPVLVPEGPVEDRVVHSDRDGTVLGPFDDRVRPEVEQDLLVERTSLALGVANHHAVEHVGIAEGRIAVADEREGVAVPDQSGSEFEARPEHMERRPGADELHVARRDHRAAAVDRDEFPSGAGGPVVAGPHADRDESLAELGVPDRHPDPVFEAGAERGGRRGDGRGGGHGFAAHAAGPHREDEEGEDWGQRANHVEQRLRIRANPNRTSRV